MGCVLCKSESRFWKYYILNNKYYICFTCFYEGYSHIPKVQREKFFRDLIIKEEEVEL